MQTDVLLSPSGDRSGRRSIRAQTDRGHPKVARRGRASHHAAHHAALHGALRGARRIKRRSLLDAAPVVMRGDRRANRRVGRGAQRASRHERVTRRAPVTWTHGLSQRAQDSFAGKSVMGRCSSPLMTMKPKTTLERKETCTRVGLEPSSHAVGAWAPFLLLCCREHRKRHHREQKRLSRRATKANHHEPAESHRHGWSAEGTRLAPESCE